MLINRSSKYFVEIYGKKLYLVNYKNTTYASVIRKIFGANEIDNKFFVTPMPKY